MIMLKLIKFSSALIICVLVVLAPCGEAAVSCNTVFGSLIPCLSFVMNGGKKVPPACCSGIRSLYTAAKTTADRRSVCACLKSATSSVSGINFKYAAQLPGKCGVKNIPFKISPNVDCSKIK